MGKGGVVKVSLVEWVEMKLGIMVSEHDLDGFTKEQEGSEVTFTVNFDDGDVLTIILDVTS